MRLDIIAMLDKFAEYEDAKVEFSVEGMWLHTRIAVHTDHGWQGSAFDLSFDNQPAGALDNCLDYAARELKRYLERLDDYG